jgi:WD40 repeat protein
MTSFTGEEGVNSDKFATAYCDITPVSGIGLNPDVSDPILYLNRSAILFIIGKYIAVQNLQTKEVCLLDPNVETNCSLGEITAFTLCPKRKYLAVCRSNNARTDSTSVFIYNVKEKKKRSSQEVHNKQAFLRGHELLRVLKMAYERIVSIAFSTDSNLICCQSNNASWTFTIWDWSRSREIATADAYYKVDRIRFNVVDVAQISSSGGNLLRVWSLSEYTLKTFATFKTSEDGKQKQCSNYVDHVWLPDDCLVALQEDGDVKLIVNAELVQVIRSIHSPRMVSAIDSLWNGEGVVVGGAEGYISIIRVEMKSIKSYEKEMHVQRRIKVHE